MYPSQLTNDMRNIANITARLIIALAATSAMMSCTDELDSGLRTDGSDFISLYLGEPGLTVASRGADSSSEAMSCRGEAIADTTTSSSVHSVMLGKDTVDIKLESRKNTSRRTSFDSRTSLVTTGTLSFTNIFVLKNDGSGYFDGTVDFSSGDNAPVQLPVGWPDDGSNLSFFSCRAGDEAGVTDRHVDALAVSRSDDSHSFSFAARLGDDTEDVPDVVCAIASARTSAGGAVPLRHHHALNAVVFSIGAMPEGVELVRIGISNIFTSGVCNVMATDGENVRFEWTGQNDKSTVWLDFESAAATSDKLMMVIPQEMNEDVELLMQYRFTAGSQTVTASKRLVKVIPEGFLADYKYTITIGKISDDVDISVSDEQHPTYKDNLIIRNTGNAPGYIRAAIVGSWVDVYYIVGYNWLPDTGVFEGIDSRWTRRSDGFWYYGEIVMPGDATAPLFTRYYIPEKPAPGYYLQLDILGQIVHYSSNPW